jgi:parallel beta-helix repeat protein
VPGNYVVTTDLSCGGIGIVVNASNVSINLNGHIIQAPIGVPTPPFGIEVQPPGLARLSQIGISGPGLIQGYSQGIVISSSDYVQVSLMVLADNALAGISGSNVTALTIGGNVIGGTTIGPGLQLNLSTGAQVTGNQMVGNALGIALQSGDSNVLTGNVVSGNTGSGIVLGIGPLTNSRISSNTTNVNGHAGIEVLFMPPSTFFGNQIFNNTSSVGNKAFDLEDANPSCGTDFWSGNVHFTTFQTPPPPPSCVK